MPESPLVDARAPARASTPFLPLSDLLNNVLRDTPIKFLATNPNPDHVPRFEIVWKIAVIMR